MSLRITLTWLALIALLAATMVASLYLTGIPGLFVGMTIAVCKAALVVSIFIHLKDQSGLMRISALGASIWLLIMIFLIGVDYTTR